jgi:hypothetical protein
LSIGAGGGQRRLAHDHQPALERGMAAHPGNRISGDLLASAAMDESSGSGVLCLDPPNGIEPSQLRRGPMFHVKHRASAQRRVAASVDELLRAVDDMCSKQFRHYVCAAG